MEPKQILKHLVVRSDTYGLQTKDGWKTVESELTDAVLDAHLQGMFALGCFTLDKNSDCRWIAFDFDDDSPEIKAEHLWGTIQQTEFAHSTLMTSTGGRDGHGRHIFVLFANMIPGAQGKAIGSRLLTEAHLGWNDCDFFPRQTKTSTEHPYGNFIRAPFGYHPVAGAWFQLIHPANLTELKPIMLVREEIVVDTPKEEQAHTQNKPQKMERYKYPCWNAISDGVAEGSRDVAGLALARHYSVLIDDAVAKQKKPPTDEERVDILRAMMVGWNKRNKPLLPDLDIERLVHRGPAYSMGCNRMQTTSELAEFCKQAQCPIGKKQLAEGAALTMLNSPTLLVDIEHILDGPIVGERDAKMTVFLSALSTLHPINKLKVNSVLRSRTATGKSFIMKNVLKCFPEHDPESDEGMVISHSRITTHALEYEEHNFDGKIISIDELGGTGQQANVRIMLSDGGFSLLSLAKNEKGRQDTLRIKTTGTPVLISTTTDLGGDEEFKNRTLSVPCDESQEQTERVLDKLTEDSDDEFNPVALQVLVEKLERVNVRLPDWLGTAIRKNYPSEIGYPRRDYTKLWMLVKTSALLYQLQRKRDEKGRIIATLDDLRYVLDYCKTPLLTTIKDMHPTAEFVYKTIRKMNANGKSATYRTLHDETNLSRRQLVRIIEELNAIGTVETDKTGGSNHFGASGHMAEVPAKFLNMFNEAERAMHDSEKP